MVPGRGTKIPQAAWHGPKKKRKKKKPEVRIFPSVSALGTG